MRASAAATVSDIAVADGALLCVSAGAGPALLMLHGWTLDHRMWRPQRDAFAADHLVITPDRRGFGRSTAPPDPAPESDDVIALLDHYGAERAILVGMSQGGRPALEVALRHPSRVAALVLQGARFGAADSTPEVPVADYTNLIRTGRLDEMKRRWRTHPLMTAVTPEAQGEADAILAAYDGRDLIAAMPPAPQLNAADVAGIAAPTLIITGVLDTPGRHAAAAALAQALPNARQIDIADAGHLCNLCQPDAYNAALRQFIASEA